VFRGASDVYIQSRDRKPLDRYFPELHETLLQQLPKDCVIDGEIVIATSHGLDFDALQMRLHPLPRRGQARARDAGELRRIRLARLERARPHGDRAKRASRAPREAVREGPLPAPSHADDARPRLAEEWLEQFEARAWMG